MHTSYHSSGMRIMSGVSYCPCEYGSINPGINEFREFGEFDAPNGETVCVGWIGERSTGRVTSVVWHTKNH